LVVYTIVSEMHGHTNIKHSRPARTPFTAHTSLLRPYPTRTEGYPLRNMTKTAFLNEGNEAAINKK